MSKKLLIVALVDVDIPTDDKDDIDFLMNNILTEKEDGLWLWSGLAEQIGSVNKVYFKKLVGDFDEFMILEDMVYRKEGVIVSSILHQEKTEKEKYYESSPRCLTCDREMTIVRPGSYQCENCEGI